MGKIIKMIQPSKNPEYKLEIEWGLTQTPDIPGQDQFYVITASSAHYRVEQAIASLAPWRIRYTKWKIRRQLEALEQE